jgi:hypothetical protein
VELQDTDRIIARLLEHSEGRWVCVDGLALRNEQPTCCMSGSSGKFVKSNHSEEGANELYVMC